VRRRRVLPLIAALIASLIVPMAATAQPAEPAVELTLLHTNDFHGRLEPDASLRGGAAYLAGAINQVRDEVGPDNVALLDAGDVYLAGPAISQLLLGESTIDVYNLMGYDAAAFGNHEFDKGQEELAIRVAQSDFPWLGANVVLEGTEWDLPPWAQPYELLEVGGITLGVLGLAGEETPEVTLLGTTAGLVFKDLTDTILHYYDEVMTQADAMVVLVHMGTADSGPYDGLVSVATALQAAGKPVDLMIGGHQHQALFSPVYVGDTAIVSAGHSGRYLGRVDVTVDPTTKELSVADYGLITITAGPSLDALVDELDTAIEAGAISPKGMVTSLLKSLEGVQADVAKGNIKAATNKLRAFVNKVTAQAGKQIDAATAEDLITHAEAVLAGAPASLARAYDAEVAARVAYWASVVAPLVEAPVAATNIDLIRQYNDESTMGNIVTDSMRWKADLLDDGELNGSVDVAFTNAGGLRADITIPAGASLPHTITWGDTFEVLPFANTLYLMDLTGAQIQTLLDQSASLYKGILQSSGAEYHWYNDTGSATPTAWGAYGVTIGDEPLVRDEVYTVVTNDFLAGGQDGFVTFAEGTERWATYYDMQQAFVEYLEELEVVDAEDISMGRIIRLDDVVTMLHTNDTHGRWEADSSGDGMVRVADLIAKERAHNPNAVLLDAGDTFQGNSFAYFYKDRLDNPIAGGMNLLGYDAMVIGNHEFNFGPTTFATMLGQVDFPLLGSANLIDDGAYGLAASGVRDHVVLDVNGLEVAVFGLTNPRVYRYELPTNIPGLTFLPVDQEDPEAIDLQGLVDSLRAEDPDLVVGLTHVGYAPYSDEVDSDTRIAQQIAGIDVLIGGHSHTVLNPAVLVSDPTGNPDGTLIAQAQRYAQWLGKVNVGLIDGEVVLREGYLISTDEAAIDPSLNTFLAPYLAEINAYNATVIGSTTVPIDAVLAYTQETNGANLQADAAVWELDDKAAVEVDLHLSGAMTSAAVALGATSATPVELTNGNMFTLMPYENSLVVLEMTGPQIKRVLERSYRNWWWYSQPYPWGGYSHYTTCMLTTDAGNQITYTGGAVTGDNVVSMTLGGAAIDFDDPTTTYTVSTVNYLAAGSCNYNDAGETIWPLDQITHDTQLYVRDSVLRYIDAQPAPIAPAIEGRLQFHAPA
jgi:5'-nucleotidase / UDP-sugar diphosphatase